MDFTLIAIITIVCISTLVGILLYLRYLKDIKNKELNLRKYELYSKINLESVNKSIDEYINAELTDYISKYVLSTGIDYIKEDDANKLAKEVTKKVLVSLSDLYIFYIKLLYGINNQDDLLDYVYKKVSDACIVFISDFNTPKQ